MLHMRPTSIKLRLATEEDQHLPAYDNTKLQAINTCPTWGIIRYVKHKQMPGAGRAMALEAGAAAHEVFAALRLWQLWKTQGLWSHFQHHAKRLFGEDRFMQMMAKLAEVENEDERTQCIHFCLEALYTSGFYDDPNDKKRTLTNLEESCIAYIDRWHWNDPVWVQDENDPTSLVGVEVPFDLVVEYEFADGTVKRYRFVGKIDGIHVRNSEPTLHENKTASRLDEAWRQSFNMSSQITGYALATTTIIQQPVTRAEVFGLTIPLPKTVQYGGYSRDVVRREDFKYHHWFNWFLHTVSIAEAYEDDVANAPQYTHSCNRYFRPCSLMAYCDSPDEDKVQILEEMEINEWSPLHEGKGTD